MKRSTRAFSLALASLLLLSACGGNAPAVSDTTTTADTTAEVTTDEPKGREDISDGLPDKTYNDQTFRIATETNMSWQIIQEEETGDVIDDAIFARNLAVEDRFKVKFETIHDGYNEIGSKVMNSIQAGDDEYDLCSLHVVRTGKYITDGLFMNWYDIPCVDFSKPWWSPSTTNDLSVGDTCFLAVGDFALSALERTYAVFYNKRLAEEYKIGDIYDIVNSGKWTHDKALSISRDIYSDLDGDGTRSDKDLYGWVCLDRSPLDSYLWAYGGKVLEKTKDGIELVYHTARTGDMIEKLCSFFFDNEGIYLYNTQTVLNWQLANDHFIDGRALFMNGTINTAVQNLREMKDDFGIIPYPKFDEDQENYITNVDGGHDVLCVPVTVSDTERTGIITEALCAESYKKVVPAYYEVALKTKYTRDDESIAMIDNIVNSRVFDLGYVYDGWMGASFIFSRLIAVDNPNFESYWASNESSISEYYKKIIDYFDNYNK